VDFQYRKTTDSVVLEVKRSGSGDCWVEFSPAFSLRTEVIRAEMNGHPLPFKVQESSNDKHVYLRFQVSGAADSVVIRVKKDFGLELANDLPSLGSASRGLRIISESWNPARTQMDLEVAGLAGTGYGLGVWNPGQISSVEGAALTSAGKLEIQMPTGPAEAYVQQKVAIHFARP